MYKNQKDSQVGEVRVMYHCLPAYFVISDLLFCQIMLYNYVLGAFYGKIKIEIIYF